MSTGTIAKNFRNTLKHTLVSSRQRTDELFKVITPDALYARPIRERHRLIFYLGHLEAFDWNLIGSGVFALDSGNKEFDRLFAFGIDPTNGNLPDDQPHHWPSEAEVRNYNSTVRQALDETLDRLESDQLLWVAIEHRLMHAETLAYLFHRLPFSMKVSHQAPAAVDASPVVNDSVAIPAGIATLGMSRSEGRFGWDNEFEVNQVHVPSFRIDKYKVTNLEFLEFVRAGGYSERSLWSEAAWTWIQSEEIRHPGFWNREGERWTIRTMFADSPWQPYWPVYVSHAEAEAYSRWKGKALPTEAQFHRAAYGQPSGEERAYPWGSEPPQARHGNFDFNSWDPARVDAHPAGDSAFGVSGLVGNGWEWTATAFAPFPGFRIFEFYPGYSADFFDGNHYVLKGGCSQTAGIFLRRSFRNWFQPHYPNIYAGFHCVEN